MVKSYQQTEFGIRQYECESSYVSFTALGKRAPQLHCRILHHLYLEDEMGVSMVYNMYYMHSLRDWAVRNARTISWYGWCHGESGILAKSRSEMRFSNQGPLTRL